MPLTINEKNKLSNVRSADIAYYYCNDVELTTIHNINNCSSHSRLVFLLKLLDILCFDIVDFLDSFRLFLLQDNDNIVFGEFLNYNEKLYEYMILDKLMKLYHSHTSQITCFDDMQLFLLQCLNDEEEKEEEMSIEEINIKINNITEDIQKQKEQEEQNHILAYVPGQEGQVLTIDRPDNGNRMLRAANVEHRHTISIMNQPRSGGGISMLTTISPHGIRYTNDSKPKEYVHNPDLKAEEAKANKVICFACMTNEPNYVSVPCGHTLACHECQPLWWKSPFPKCPQCKGIISQCMRLHMQIEEST
jgi:hypothetical protein